MWSSPAARAIDQGAVILARHVVPARIRPDFGFEPGSILQLVIRLFETDTAVALAGHQAAFVVRAAAQGAGGIPESIAALKRAAVQGQFPPLRAGGRAFPDQAPGC